MKVTEEASIAEEEAEGSDMPSRRGNRGGEVDLVEREVSSTERSELLCPFRLLTDHFAADRHRS